MIELTSPRRILLHAIFDKYLSYQQNIPSWIPLICLNHEISVLYVQLSLSIIKSWKEFLHLSSLNVVDFHLVKPVGGSFGELRLSVDFAGYLFLLIDLLVEWGIFVYLFLEVWELWRFRNGRDLWS